MIIRIKGRNSPIVFELDVYILLSGYVKIVTFYVCAPSISAQCSVDCLNFFSISTMLLATTHLLSLSLLLATAIAAPSPTAASSAPIVSNPATGVSFKGSLSSGIESFLNIRFGENTSGANRFALPKHFSYPHHTVVDASAAGAACPQSNTSGIIPSVVTSVSEDCLTLRVDRLANTTEGDNLPVMIWVFGGGFTTGQIYNPDFNPTALLKSAEANGSPFIYAAVKYVCHLPASFPYALQRFHNS